jgi:Na+/H+ antiporter NhaD/arsenite permease-like protein
MIFLACAIFIIGYLLITLEGVVKMNKAATALITGITLWIIYFSSRSDNNIATTALSQEMGKISEILFFLLGAMTIVEVIDSQKGFYSITKFLQFHSLLKLWWITGLFTFFLSALIDNLTATIVMITIVNKLLKNKQNLLLFSAMIVIASNAGGAWSPIGDVTTSMLWIGEQVSSTQLIVHLFLPSLISCVVAQWLLSKSLDQKEKYQIEIIANNKDGKQLLLLGTLVIITVPVAKSLFHIPPFLGMLLGLAIVWIYVEFKNRKTEQSIGIANALQKIDTPTILFFLGILLSVGALEKMEVLKLCAENLLEKTNNIYLINTLIGLFSAIVDNVPLVAAMQSMFNLDDYPKDHAFWQLLTYCAGTGGSILVIGSAAGVAAMGIQKIDFLWYLKKVTWAAIISYFLGLLVFFMLHIQ